MLDNDDLPFNGPTGSAQGRQRPSNLSNSMLVVPGTRLAVLVQGTDADPYYLLPPLAGCL